jgi:hypothetical protein
LTTILCCRLEAGFISDGIVTQIVTQISDTNPLIKRSQQGSSRGSLGWWADVDGGLRTVTDLIALLSMLLSPVARRVSPAPQP